MELIKNGLFNNTTQKQQLFAKLKQKSELRKVFILKGKENEARSCSSEKERKVNALAPKAEEGRDNLR